MSKQIYLIADAALPFNILNEKVKAATENGISKLQLYNTEHCAQENLLLIKDQCARSGVELYIYNDARLAKSINADGVHFDEVPQNISELSTLRFGITVGNDFSKILAAEEAGAAYISFCSVFPTKSANVCSLVEPQNIREARQYFSREIFLAGGISVQNVPALKDLDFDGIAVISEIMECYDIPQTIKTLKNLLSQSHGTPDSQ